MAQYETTTIAVPAANGTGAALDVDQKDGKYVELSGTFVATVTFQASFDGGTTWRNIHDAFTAPDGFFLDEPCTHVRAVTSGYGSGTPAALVRWSW